MKKIRLKLIGILRDGGSKLYIPFDAIEPNTIKEGQEVIANAYYLDNGFSSITKGKLFINKQKLQELNIEDYEFDR